ncbi:MAG: type II toxin-antitoxin system RelE/ParE family toxin [Fimbriimonadaceae bacterium]|nr:type II toxin-antitoxin system RelE/ParE family toxin [Fimbriimonadaceae bacterium]
MRREFEPFDEEVILAELESLPTKDRSKLAALMEFYEEVETGNPYPAQIDLYDHGIYRIRHAKASYQGRALFCVSEAREGYQKLTLLVVYKKESHKVPAAILQTARRRMEQHKKGKP